MAEQPYNDIGQNSYPGGGFIGIARKRKRALNILTKIAPQIASMERLVEIIKKYQLMLYEPLLLFRYRKDWIAFLLAFKLYNGYKLGNINNDAAKRYIQQIIFYDKELADQIENVLPVTADDSGIFSELLNELKKGKQYFVSYISTHPSELIEKAKSLKDKDPKLSEQLVDLFSKISGHEIDFLIQYRQDCEDWLHYAVGYNIDFFINRISLFLNGGFDNSSRTQLKGLYRDFGDEKLRREMVRNNAVRNLWFYNQQLRYLYYLIDLCIKAQASKSWEGFYGKKGFWTDFDKYAKAFEKDYGNTDFSERLLTEKKKTGNELPQFWGGVWQKSAYHIQDQQMLNSQGIIYIIIGGEVYTLAQDGILPRLLRDLKSKSYLAKNLINPAAAALMRIFEERENELKANLNQSVRYLIKLLLSISGIPKIRKFRKLLRKKKRMSLKELNNDMIEFIGKSSDPLLKHDNLADEQEGGENRESVFEKISAYYLAQKTRKFVRARNTHLVYEDRQIETGQILKKGDISGLTLAGVAEELATYLQAKKIDYERLEHLTEKDFEYLRSLTPRIREIIMGLMGVYSYIRIAMPQNYTLKPEALEVMELDFKKRKNRSCDLAYVQKMINRLV